MKINKCLIKCGIILLMLTMDIHGSTLDYNNRDLKKIQNIEVIYQRSGYDIKLKCGLEGLHSKENLEDGAKIRWFYKQCGDNSMQKPCREVPTADWIELPCKENFCNSTLQLRNLTDNYSGLYKCTLYPIKMDDTLTLDIRLVRTYQLHVKNSTVLIPEFLGPFPANNTSSVGSKVVFQCRVQSVAHPTIKWFKRVKDLNDGLEFSLGNNNFNSRIVKYLDSTYELLDTPREKSVTEDTYLSKLILNSLTKEDKGYYACVAINYKGHNIREAYLTVDSENENYEYIREETTDPMEFLLLFLMPVGLAILPLSFWLCYIANKKCSDKNEEYVFDEERSLRK